MLQKLPRHRRRQRPDREPIVLAYTRVSTEEQAISGAGLGDQRANIEREAAHRGWADVRWIEDAGYSAKSLDRPGIQQAIGLLGSGQADVLVVSKLDRLARSLLDFANLMERSREEGWSIVALDLGVDTTTTNGRMIAGVVAVLAQWERELISERIKAALAVKQAQGVRVGRPVEIPAEVHARIMKARKDGIPYSAIAAQLNADGVPTARGGGTWYPSSVYAAVRSTR